MLLLCPNLLWSLSFFAKVSCDLSHSLHKYLVISLVRASVYSITLGVTSKGDSQRIMSLRDVTVLSESVWFLLHGLEMSCRLNYRSFFQDWRHILKPKELIALKNKTDNISVKPWGSCIYWSKIKSITSLSNHEAPAYTYRKLGITPSYSLSTMSAPWYDVFFPDTWKCVKGNSNATRRGRACLSYFVQMLSDWLKDLNLECVCVEVMIWAIQWRDVMMDFRPQELKRTAEVAFSMAPQSCNDTFTAFNRSFWAEHHTLWCDCARPCCSTQCV